MYAPLKCGRPDSFACGGQNPLLDTVVGIKAKEEVMGIIGLLVTIILIILLLRLI